MLSTHTFKYGEVCPANWQEEGKRYNECYLNATAEYLSCKTKNIKMKNDKAEHFGSAFCKLPFVQKFEMMKMY